MPELTDDLLAHAVVAIWSGAGQTPPHGDERKRAVQVLRGAFAAGLNVPRQTDKTVMPLTGPRNDIG